MGHLVRTLAAASGVFAGTNMDGLMVLTTLFLSSRATGHPRPWQIVAGQCIFLAVLIAISALAGAGLKVVPDHWVGLLGLVPFGMGAHGLTTAVRARRAHDDTLAPIAGGTWAVAGVTIANGGDNVSLYTPLFRALSLTDGVVTVCAFAVLAVVWCAVAYWISSYKQLISLVSRFGRWFVPIVYLTIGAVIVAVSGVVDAAAGAAR